jgi:hypothetical protein
MAQDCRKFFIFRKPPAAMVPAMFTAARPALAPDTLLGTHAVEAPLIALFESEEAALAALPRLGGARVLRRPSAGVRMLAPMPGLRETLYAAGALLVVG